MTYSLVIKRQAKKKLESLTKKDRYRITEKIVLLGKNPDDPNLDLKLLEGNSFYRLRVGSWRVIYERNNEIRVLLIDKIKPRGDAYK